MDRSRLLRRLEGCYVPIPSLFREDDLELNLPAMRRHVRYLIDSGLREGMGVILVAGGAGDFSVMTVDERLRALAAVREEAGDALGILLGAQTTDQRELVALARGAAKLGVEYLQVSPPFYHAHTDDDVLEFFQAAIDAAPELGLVVYTTYWTGFRFTPELLDRLVEIPQVVGIKLATPSAREFVGQLHRYTRKCCVIDNQLDFVRSHMAGGRGVNLHPTNWWPAWGVKFWQTLERQDYLAAQRMMDQVIEPFYGLLDEIAQFTGGDGHLDKLFLELLGLEPSRSRGPTRDIRPKFRDAARKLLVQMGVPRIDGAAFK